MSKQIKSSLFFQFGGFYRGMHFPLITNGAINSVIYAVYGGHLRTLEKKYVTQLTTANYC